MTNEELQLLHHLNTKASQLLGPQYEAFNTSLTDEGTILLSGYSIEKAWRTTIRLDNEDNPEVLEHVTKIEEDKWWD